MQTTITTNTSRPSSEANFIRIKEDYRVPKDQVIFAYEPEDRCKCAEVCPCCGKKKQLAPPWDITC